MKVEVKRTGVCEDVEAIVVLIPENEDDQRVLRQMADEKLLCYQRHASLNPLTFKDAEVLALRVVPPNFTGP